ncbi:LOW QUALITY PROTEIN: cytochrome P450 6A1-like [Nomia melanderi]|uniref:LOW QUALITY PROTEIN: cytochrome P450 6A1-like n=1 Tax=Nomia melanderi TaxID=2448451 RepID=UPI003FCE4FF0
MLGSVEIVCGLAILAVLFYYYMTWKYDFWIKHGIPGPKPKLFFGTSKDLILARTTLGHYTKQVYDEFNGTPLIGLFMGRQPTLFLNSLDLIKDVLIKDFNKFSDRGFKCQPRVEPLSQNILNLEPAQWRPLRSKLSPVFSSGKLKDMYSFIVDCSTNVIKYLDRVVEKGDIVKVRNITQKYTLDVIGNCGFGIETKVLENRLFFPEFYNFLGHIVPEKKITGFFTKLVAETIEYRERNNIRRLDFINVLMEMKKTQCFYSPKKISSPAHLKRPPWAVGLGSLGSNQLRPKPYQRCLSGMMSPVKILYAFHISFIDHQTKSVQGQVDSSTYDAQAAIAFDTCSLLAPTITKEGSKPECGETVGSIELLFRALLTLQASTGPVGMLPLRSQQQCPVSLPYRDLVGPAQVPWDRQFPYHNRHAASGSKTLRLYPIAPVLFRRAIEDYTFHDTKFTIPKDMYVWISIYALHRDPEYFPNPHIFDPERFNEEAIAARHSMCYLPFGDGPRNCIGERFSHFQSKLGMIKILRNYKMDVCEKTFIPYEFDLQASLMAPKEDIYLRITKLKK